MRLRKILPDVSYLNAYYEWDPDIYFPEKNVMFNYICDHYEELKEDKRFFKVKFCSFVIGNLYSCIEV